MLLKGFLLIMGFIFVEIKEVKKMKTILVTGCAGFIGSHFTEFLLSEGKSVAGIDNFNDYYNPAFKTFQGLLIMKNSLFIEQISAIKKHLKKFSKKTKLKK